MVSVMGTQSTAQLELYRVASFGNLDQRLENSQIIFSRGEGHREMVRAEDVWETIRGKGSHVVHVGEKVRGEGERESGEDQENGSAAREGKR